MMIQVPGRPDYRPIRIQTRRGTDIENRQVNEISQTEIANMPDYSALYRGVRFRNPPNPIYNCHGMTFACARTTIGPESVPMILKDDGYTEVRIQDVLPGDVIIYYNDADEILHSGIVVKSPSEQTIKIPWVVSKWGKYSEAYHQAYDVPYRPIGRVRYWRITT